MAHRVDEICSLLEISDRKTRIGKLSEGNKKKVSIAASLIHNPKFLIYDEPFTNIDAKTSNILLEIFKSFKGKKTLLITSHDINLLLTLCDHFLVIDQGKMVADYHKNKSSSVSQLKKEIMEKVSSKAPTIKNLKWLG